MRLELTTQEIAERLGIDKGEAYGLVGFLEKMGLVQAIGTKKAPGSKGKGATVYALDASLPARASELLGKIFPAA